MNDHRCPTCGVSMTAYSAHLRDETAMEAGWWGREPRGPGYYAEPCCHRVIVFEGPRLHFARHPDGR